MRDRLFLLTTVFDHFLSDESPPVTTVSPNVKRQASKMREYFVKYVGKSYWKCTWVSEIRVCS